MLWRPGSPDYEGELWVEAFASETSAN